MTDKPNTKRDSLSADDRDRQRIAEVREAVRRAPAMVVVLAIVGLAQIGAGVWAAWQLPSLLGGSGEAAGGQKLLRTGLAVGVFVGAFFAWGLALLAYAAHGLRDLSRDRAMLRILDATDDDRDDAPPTP